MATCSGGPFASFNDDEFNDIVTKMWQIPKDQRNKHFCDYLKEKSLPGDFETLDKKSLARILGNFYVEARNALSMEITTRSQC